MKHNFQHLEKFGSIEISKKILSFQNKNFLRTKNFRDILMLNIYSIFLAPKRAFLGVFEILFTLRTRTRAIAKIVLENNFASDFSA